MTRRPSFDQHQIMNWLDSGPATARALAEALSHTGVTVAAVRLRLRRMEDRGWVRRTYRGDDPAKWELTAAGRDARERS